MMGLSRYFFSVVIAYCPPCDFLCWQGPITNERTILSNFIANT